MKRKKWIVLLCTLLFLLIVTLAGCGEETSKECEHEWTDATCTEPATCSVCGETQGEKLAHDVEEWTVVSESTCSVVGAQEGVCKICGETVTEELPLKDHTAGEWVITKEATESSPGKKALKCSVCGAEMETKAFQLSLDEKKTLYATGITYSQLARTPDDYKYSKVKFSGRVLQVSTQDEYNIIRLATNGKWDDVVMVIYDPSEVSVRLLEDDKITIYGLSAGITSYTTVLGATVELPLIKADYIDL